MPIESGQTDPFSFRLTTSLRPPPATISISSTTTTLYFRPVSTQSASSQSSSFTSLDMTTYISGGKTQTFSKAQNLVSRSITKVTTKTSTYTRTISGTATTSSTTVVPVYIQVGGFYWSPVPNPTGDIPIGSFPTAPPIPSPPCFTLGNIFSIDCPPNKNLPTTTYYSDSPYPTCTSNCGSLCTSDCDASTSSSDCEKATATDYWVSCSSTSCTTTRTATITGCSVTGSTTTTGSYCPTPTVFSVDDDQGQEGPTPSISYTKTTTYSPLVSVSSTVYRVETSYITISGTPVKVPSVSDLATKTTTLSGGYSATIYGGSSGVVTLWSRPTAYTVEPSTVTITSTLQPSRTTVTVVVTPTPTVISIDCKGSKFCSIYTDLDQYCDAVPDVLVADTNYKYVDHHLDYLIRCADFWIAPMREPATQENVLLILLDLAVASSSKEATASVLARNCFSKSQLHCHTI